LFIVRRWQMRHSRCEIRDKLYESRVTSHESRFGRAFTLIELVVSIGILAMVLSFAGVIFRVSINSHRTAIANAEIMQKLRAITEQLNADFKGLRKNGEIFVTWVALRKPGADPSRADAYERLDRIMFFADGDFQSYRTNPLIRGNLARICYMLGNRTDAKAEVQSCAKRVLARTQHILTDDPTLTDFLKAKSLNWEVWNNWDEYDKISLKAWKDIPWETNESMPAKKDMLSVINDVTVDHSSIPKEIRGAKVDPTDSNSIHMLLCEGVGEFKIQGWYDVQQRWVPEHDLNGDGLLTGPRDSDFFLVGNSNEPDAENVPGVVYPHRVVKISNISYPAQLIDAAHFNSIPGFGRALKFTFTLYDSKAVIKKGRTFTHIVYLD